MVGLILASNNPSASDTSESFNNGSYALNYQNNQNTLRKYTNGTLTVLNEPLSSSDTISIIYSGTTVEYQKNGTTLSTDTVSAGLIFHAKIENYIDSSYSSDATIFENIIYGEKYISLDLGASSITGTLAVSDGGTGSTDNTAWLNSNNHFFKTIL